MWASFVRNIYQNEKEISNEKATQEFNIFIDFISGHGVVLDGV